MDAISTDLITRAEAFAREVHARQTRKGEAAEPYVTHLETVVALLRAADMPAETIAAGWLHDTIEDGHEHGYPVTLHDLAERFGWPVAAIVAEVSDEKLIPKALRKDLQVRHAPRASAAARAVKLADKVSNLRAILESPPGGWDHGRKVEYFGWAARVAAGCRGVSPVLDEAFDRAYREGLRWLAETA
ncbi:HD domain-containing protein [Elioraea sp.]|uniref:HD domain-containing protein n=1 Tax=Elioraea sp. TaxID=2185103 RepID=UPI003F6FF40F